MLASILTTDEQSSYYKVYGISAENITEILEKFLKFLPDVAEVFKILLLGNNVS